MKNTLIILILVFYFSTDSFPQKKDDVFFEITITSGMGYFGITKIQLQYEGLFCRTFTMKKNGKLNDAVVKFFPMKKLNYQQLLKVYDLINDSSIMKITKIGEPDSLSQQYEYRPYIDIRSYEVFKQEFWYLQYGYYDNRINLLIEYMNELVPKKYRDIFYIRKSGILGTPVD